MNTEQIRKLLIKRCRGSFMGVYSSDRLPRRLPKRRPVMLVCNTDPHKKPGQHWVAFYFAKDGSAEYFDSFGASPTRFGSFHNFLVKNCSRWIMNSKQIQSIVSQFCGHYVVMYCLFKHLNYSMKSIMNCFSNDTGLNDFIARDFVEKKL